MSDLGVITNQCDGCMQGNIPDELGMHRYANGVPFMICMREVYAVPSSVDSVDSFIEWIKSGGCDE